MARESDGFWDDAPARPMLARFRALSTGTRLTLASALLLFFSLFLTWQTLEIDYGRAGTATEMQDGWEVWGLLIGFASLGLIALVVLVQASDVELSPEVPWEALVLALAAALLGLTVVKSLTDADSAWASYLGIVLAAGAVAGTYLDWSRDRRDQLSRLSRSTRSSPGPS